MNEILHLRTLMPMLSNHVINAIASICLKNLFQVLIR